jgi:hypothetical protein
MNAPDPIIAKSDCFLDASLVPFADCLTVPPKVGRYRGSNPWLFLVLLLCASFFSAQRVSFQTGPARTPSVRSFAFPLKNFLLSHKARLGRVFFEEGGKP